MDDFIPVREAEVRFDLARLLALQFSDIARIVAG
jgi:hypothetical protein